MFFQALRETLRNSKPIFSRVLLLEVRDRTGKAGT